MKRLLIATLLSTALSAQADTGTIILCGPTVTCTENGKVSSCQMISNNIPRFFHVGNQDAKYVQTGVTYQVTSVVLTQVSSGRNLYNVTCGFDGAGKHIRAVSENPLVPSRTPGDGWRSQPGNLPDICLNALNCPLTTRK